MKFHALRSVLTNAPIDPGTYEQMLAAIKETESCFEAVVKTKVNEAVNNHFYYPDYVLNAIKEERIACINLMNERAEQFRLLANQSYSADGKFYNAAVSAAFMSAAEGIRDRGELTNKPQPKPGRLVPVDHKPAGYNCAEGNCGHRD